MNGAKTFLSNGDVVAPSWLLKRAVSSTPPRVAIACAGASLPMQAAKDAAEKDLMHPVFVGDPDVISANADALSWDISSFPVHSAKGEAEGGLVAAKLCGAGDADILMKGHLHTDQFMKAALNKEAGLRTGDRLVHVFMMTKDNSAPLLVSDAAVNVAPDLETRKAAIKHCIKILHTIGTQRPRIALLSATESAIPSVPSSMDAKELADWAKTQDLDADVSGPLAMDLILSLDAAKTKGLGDDQVAGQADAVITPDIVSGNTLFKTLIYTCNACSAGVVLGAKVPILLTSRADPPAARIASIALAGLLSAQRNAT